MKYFLVLISIFFVPIFANDSTTESPEDDGRIFNGRLALRTEFPYQVSIQKKTKISNTLETVIVTSHQCGGVIINREWILTAAHCFYNVENPTDFIIAAGNTNCYDFRPPGQQRAIKEAILHKRYSNETDLNDIALLKIDSPLTFNENVQPIALPPANYTKPEGYGWILGWGEIGVNRYNHSVNRDLLSSHITISPNSECEYYFANIGKLHHQICFSNKKSRACQGDSGGPFVQNVDGKPRVVGITSVGDADCIKFTNVLYTKVSSYLDWIDAVVTGKKYTEPGVLNQIFNRIG